MFHQISPRPSFLGLGNQVTWVGGPLTHTAPPPSKTKPWLLFPLLHHPLLSTSSTTYCLGPSPLRVSQEGGGEDGC